MAVQVEVPYEKTFHLNRPVQEVYDYFWDVRKSVPPNFKGLEHFEELRANTYRWSFEKVGYNNYEIGIKLVTEFSGTSPSRIDVKPIPETGASEFRGGWTFASRGTGTDVTFKVNFKIDLPIPFFVKAVAVPLAQNELKKLFDRYVDRVSKNFG